MNNYNLKRRRIRFKHKHLIKSDNIRIIIISGRTYIEAIPETTANELSCIEMEQMYNSFIQLGRDLYNANRENVNKIIICNNMIQGNFNRTLLNIKTMQKAENTMNAWLNKGVIDKLDLYSFKRKNLNYLILNNGEWETTDSLINWLKSNYIPDINEGENSNNRYVVYDDGFFVDLAIFMYLTIYSILNEKGKNSKIDKIQFNDFITFDGIDTHNFELSNYMYYVYDIINFFEKSNIHVLSGYDRVSRDENDNYRVFREYESLYGVLWYIFKLNINDLWLEDGVNSIQLNSCMDCGVPILSSSSRCDVCESNNTRNRKRKSQQMKKDNIERIKSLISVHKYPDTIVNKFNELQKTSFRDIKSESVKELLKEMQDYSSL